MTKAIFAAASLACAACANSAPTTFQEYKSQQLSGLTEHVERPLAAFAKESPKRCESKSLGDARAASLGLLQGSNSAAASAFGADGMMRIGSAVLDYADAARAANCGALAAEAYEQVIRTFVGAAYGGIRQRADIGLRTVQTARR